MTIKGDRMLRATQERYVLLSATPTKFHELNVAGMLNHER